MQASRTASEESGAAALDELEEALFALSWLGQKQFATELSPFKLTIPQFFTLLFVAADERGSTMSELANQTRHSMATMTGIVDRLVNLDLVRRGVFPDDRRIVMVELTDQGRRRLNDVQAARRHQLEQALSKLSVDDQLNLLRLLRAFSDALGVHKPTIGRTQRRAMTADAAASA